MRFKIYVLSVLSVLFIHGNSVAGNINCPEAKRGIFKVRSRDGSLHTVVRNEQVQTETSARTGNVIQSDIQWTSDCSFILFNRRLLRGSDSLKYDLKYDTLYNEIKEDNGYWETISSTYKDSTYKTTFFRIDTLKMYSDLTELDQFREYKGGKSSGTFASYNYVISCVQHPVDKSKYILAYEEALPIGNSTKYKLLDNVFCTLDSNLRITTVNCRYNDMYDKEIVAMYYSTNKKTEALIVKSWRFSKASLKIEEVPVQKVKYKEADKYLTIWEDQ
jgi:hypothetical protein